jgi:hypothetical protein
MKELMEHHKLTTSMFPVMEGEQYQVLEKDILTNGLLNPFIFTFEGKILDGRNRHKICTKHNIPMQFKEFKGTEIEAITFLVSVNLQRYHYTVGQRAIASLPAYDALSKIALSGRRQNPAPATNEEKRARLSGKKVAAMFNIGFSSVMEAVMLRRHKPELIKEIMNGNITLSRAYAMMPKIKISNNGKKIPQQDIKAREVIQAIDNREPFEIPMEFDSYEKFMLFAKQVNDRGYIIQAVWAARKVYVQIVKENEYFSTWRNGHSEFDFRRAFKVEAASRLKKESLRVAA